MSWDLLRQLQTGSVDDALVGQAALTNRRIMLTRDRRAERTYRSLDVDYRIVD